MPLLAVLKESGTVKLNRSRSPDPEQNLMPETLNNGDALNAQS